MIIQSLDAFKHADMIKTTYQSSNWEWTWGGRWLKWLWNMTRLLVPLIWAGINIWESSDLKRFSTHSHLQGLQKMARKRKNSEWQFFGWKCFCWCQRRMAALSWHEGSSNSVNVEHTSHEMLKQMGYSGRRPHSDPQSSDLDPVIVTKEVGSCI